MSQNLPFEFGRNTSTLSQFMGNADSMNVRDISPEHSRDNEK